VPPGGPITRGPSGHPGGRRLGLKNPQSSQNRQSSGNSPETKPTCSHIAPGAKLRDWSRVFHEMRLLSPSPLRGKDSNSTRQLDRQPKTPRHRQMGQGLSRPRKVQAPELRFCPNPPLRHGGGTAQGRISRDAAASTIRANTQGTRPALVGAFFPRRPCMNPLPCQDLPRKWRFFSWTRVRRATAPNRSSHFVQLSRGSN